MGIYCSPEEFNLETVGEVDFSDGCYQFDLLVVWKDQNGTLYYDEDEGCSCPVPFEDVRSVGDLTKTSKNEIYAQLDERLKTCDYKHAEANAAELKAKVAKL